MSNITATVDNLNSIVDWDAECRHCHRAIVRSDGGWIDPCATGDDAVWRETCDAHDTMVADHEPTRHQDDTPTRTVAQHMEDHHGWDGLHHDPVLAAEYHDAEHRHTDGQPESYSMEQHQDDHDALSDAS